MHSSGSECARAAPDASERSEVRARLPGRTCTGFGDGARREWTREIDLLGHALHDRHGPLGEMRRLLQREEHFVNTNSQPVHLRLKVIEVLMQTV